ncbi:3188_t:CDS:2 [Diversispora eburnea]|uniref:3188_t:CDS:1 n=1 Tax=Diversispora eburnea TaxID=1213867 RepID=A0A9N9CE24_9GLOM|nr:3188_t:CDS:2 [Diversispora eburnea]
MSLTRNFFNFNNTNNVEKENAIKLVNTVWQCFDNLIDPPLKKNEKEKVLEQQDSFEGKLFLEENTLKERLEYLNSIVTKKRQELGLSDSKLEQAFHNARLKQRRHISINDIFEEVLDQFNFFITNNSNNSNSKTPKILNVNENDDDDKLNITENENDDNDKFDIIIYDNYKFNNIITNLLIKFLIPNLLMPNSPYLFTGAIVLLLRNLYLTMKVTLKSFEVLRSSNKKFDEIIACHKNHFMLHFNNLERDLNEMVKLLQLNDQNFGKCQYEKFQMRCDSEISLEENQGTLSKTGIGAAIVGGLALLIGAAISVNPSNLENARKCGKIAAVAGGATLAATGISHLCAHYKIEKSVEYQKSMIQELTKMHKDLLKWEIGSIQIKEKDYNEMDFHTRKQLVLLFQGYEQMNERVKDFFTH